MRLDQFRHCCRLFSAWSLIVAAPGCREEVIDGPVAAVVVRGQITDTFGTPIPSAAVHLTWPCATPGPGATEVTTSDGRYIALLNEWNDHSFTRCVRVLAEPPAGASFLPDSALLPGTRFRSGEGAIDTLTVDFALRPGA